MISDAFLGIDQSFGGFGAIWYVPYGDYHASAFQRFPPEHYGSGVDRLAAVQEWLGAFLTTTAHNTGCRIAHICMEGYAMGARYAREVAGELGAAVKLALFDHPATAHTYPTIVAPTQLKLYTTGSGGATKNDMLRAVKAAWGPDFGRNHNLADAYGLSRVAQALMSPDLARSPKQKSVLAALDVQTGPPTPQMALWRLRR